jgi:hypothetical protein
VTTSQTPAGPQFPGPAGQTGTGGADVALGKGSSPLVPHWPDAPAEPPPCVCGDPRVVHDIARDGETRTRCLTWLGPRGRPCGCEKYEPESRGDGE